MSIDLQTQIYEYIIYISASGLQIKAHFLVNELNRGAVFPPLVVS